MNKLFSLGIFLFFAAVGQAQSTWQYMPDAPTTGGRYEDIFFLNSQLGWSAGASGRIFKTTDGGLNWNLMLNNNSYFRCIEFQNENIGYAGTLDAKFLRSTDGGATWKNIAPNITPTPAAVCGISIVDDAYGYAVGEWDSPGFVLKTTDGGLNWTSLDMSAHALALVDVFFTSRDTGFVTGQSPTAKGIILHTSDGGQTWQKRFESSSNGKYVWKIQRVTPDFWVGSIQTFNGGRFVKSTDGGQTWTEHAAPIPDMQGIGFATPKRGWVGGYVNGFYETLDGGDTWEFKDFGGNFNRFHFLDSTLAFASGESLYKFFDSTLSSVSQPRRPVLQDDGFQVSLSPNPASTHLDVQFYLPGRDNLRMGIYTAAGEFVRDVYHERQVSEGHYQFRAECADLPPGTYFLGVQRNHGLYSRMFVKG